MAVDRGAVIRGLRSQIDDPETGYATRLRAAERDRNQCISNRIALEDAARRQNAAVEEARQQGAARLAELDRVTASARRDAAAAQTRARSILARKAEGAACAAADALILESVR